MLLALVLTALVSQTAQDPRAAERGCIIEGLTQEQRIDLAVHFVDGAMTEVAKLAGASAAKCAAKWKWSEDTRDWQIIHSGAYSAMITLESQLPKTLNSTRLEALFGKLSPADQYALTNEGGAKLDQAAYTAVGQRATAVLTAEKLSEPEVNNAGNWFLAYAQFVESDAHLKAAEGAK